MLVCHGSNKAPGCDSAVFTYLKYALEHLAKFGRDL